jgi:hypothetical protein
MHGQSLPARVRTKSSESPVSEMNQGVGKSRVLSYRLLRFIVSRGRGREAKCQLRPRAASIMVGSNGTVLARRETTPWQMGSAK